MYDALALLDWLNSPEHGDGPVFRPAFEVNFVPTVDRDDTRRPERDETRFETTRIDPHSAKAEIALLVRHPDPLVRLTTTRQVHEQRDASHIIDDCLRVMANMATSPEVESAELGIRPVPDTGS
jgi:hypothetical protein